MLHVQCQNCGAQGWADDNSLPDAAVKCGCSTLGHSHDEHIAHVLATGDASSRPVIITAYADLEGSLYGDV